MSPRKARKTRITDKVRKLLHHLVIDGRTLAESSESVGWTLDYTHRLLKRPDILALRKELMQGVLSASGSRALKKVEDLMDRAKSSAVQLDAAQWLAGCEGIAPVARSENVHLHHHSGLVPGLVIVRGGNFPPHELPAEDVIDVPHREIRMVGTPALHPEDPRRHSAADRIAKSRVEQGYELARAQERVDRMAPKPPRQFPKPIRGDDNAA
jgi:hypothetical protein